MHTFLRKLNETADPLQSFFPRLSPCSFHYFDPWIFFLSNEMSVLIRHLVYYLFPNNYHGLSKKSLSGKLLETNLSCQRRMANFRGFPDEQWCSWNRIGKKREYQDIFSFSFEKNNLGQLSSLLTVQLYLQNSWKKWAANKANKLGKVVLCTIKIISNLKQISLLPVILGQLLSCFGAIAFALKLLRKGQANNLGKLESFIKLRVVKIYSEFKTISLTCIFIF